METINIKFDEKQLEDVVKRVTENIIKKAKEDSVTTLTVEKPKKEMALMYLSFKESGYSSEKKKVYFGYSYNTLSRRIASTFDLNNEFDLKQVEKLKSQGWKEEVIYK